MSPPLKSTLASMRWRQSIETLQDAMLLSRQGGSGRSVVNRAYYAAFYAVSALLELDGKSSNKHSGLISLFDLEYVKPGRVGKPVSSKLHALFRMRNEDDYAKTEQVSETDAAEALQNATEIMAAIRPFLPRDLPDVPDLPAIADPPTSDEGE